MKKVYTICYNTLDVFENKKDAIKFYSTACSYCDPMSCEYRRYANIVVDLQFSDIGHDGVSDEINGVYYHKNKKKVEIAWENAKNIIKKIEKGEDFNEN